MHDFPQKAMVLAAGLGMRMRSHNNTLPKPLVPVSGKTLLDWSLDRLKEANVPEVVVNTHYMADKLKEHVNMRSKPRVILSHEPVLLETGGGIAKALPFLGDTPFFVMNSDVICLNGAVPFLKRLVAAWDEATMDALLLVTPQEMAVGYDGQGDFFLETDGTLRRRGDARSAPYVFTGVQLLHPRLFRDIPDGPFSMNLLYNRKMTLQGHLHRIKGLAHDGDWLHVGDGRGVLEAEKWLEAR